MKTYKYIITALVCLILAGSFSLARADGAPPLDGSDDTSTSTTLTAPPTTGSDTSSTTSIIPPTTGSDTSSTTSIIPPMFGSDDTSTSTASAPETFTLTVNVTGGNTSDNVTSADGSINCVVSGTSCTLSTTTGTTISLTANPVSDDTFSGWSGASCTNANTTCFITLTADTSVTATFATTSSSSTTQPTNLPVFSGGGGGYSSGGGNEYIPLAATTTASSSTATLGTVLTCPLLSDYIIPGRINNPNDISKLQIFLNVNDHTNLVVDGVLNPATVSAVKAFQEKYLGQIMGPWGVNAPSGEVYITTLKKINSITCGTPIALSAEDIAIINAYKSRLTEAEAAVTNTPNTSSVNTSPAVVVPPTVAPSSDTTVSTTTTIISTTTDLNNNDLTGNAISADNTGFFGRIFSAIAGWLKSK